MSVLPLILEAEILDEPRISAAPAMTDFSTNEESAIFAYSPISELLITALCVIQAASFITEFAITRAFFSITALPYAIEPASSQHSPTVERFFALSTCPPIVPFFYYFFVYCFDVSHCFNRVETPSRI